MFRCSCTRSKRGRKWFALKKGRNTVIIQQAAQTRGLLMAKSTRDEIVDAAKVVGEGVRSSLAGEALAAAAAAVTGVVMGSVAKALINGKKKKITKKTEKGTARASKKKRVVAAKKTKRPVKKKGSKK